MKIGDAMHILWQHQKGSALMQGFIYRLSDGTTVGLNDMRAIWEYLNHDIPLDGTLKNACDGERAPYISEMDI